MTMVLVLGLKAYVKNTSGNNPKFRIKLIKVPIYSLSCWSWSWKMTRDTIANSASAKIISGTYSIIPGFILSIT